MSFIHPYFLYFLPLLLVPLLLSLIARLNRRKDVFPSLELLQDIIRRDNTARKLFIRLKQVVRALVIALVVLAFAQPFFAGGSARGGGKTVAIIDHSLSMGRFALARLSRFLSEEWSVERVYFGPEFLRNEGNEKYAVDAVQMDETVRRVLQKEGAGLPETLVIVSDGQNCNFEQPVRVPSGVRYVRIVKAIPEKIIRNIFVRNISTFPGVLFPGENTEFLAELGGSFSPGDRIRVFVNGREVFSERAREKMSFSRLMEGNWTHPGLNTGMALLEGDDFTNDNRYYFPVLSLPKPAVYSDLDSAVIHKVFSSIFPDFTVADIPGAASVVFSGRDPTVGKDKPLFLFCEDIKTTENILRREFHEFAEFNNATAVGDMVSSDPALSLIRGVRIQTKYRLKSDEHLSVSAGNTPLLYRFDNRALFTFSVKDNADYFSDSPSLLLMVNAFLMDFYRGRYLLPDTEPDLKNKKFFDENGSPADFTQTAGILKDRDSGKVTLHNAAGESEMVFLNESVLREKITGIPGNRVSYLELDTGKPRRVYPGFLTGIILMALAALLAFLELV